MRAIFVLVVTVIAVPNVYGFTAVERAILKDVERKIAPGGVNTVGEAELSKANNICQTKCTVCFDGVECNFNCVIDTCLESSGSERDAR